MPTNQPSLLPTPTCPQRPPTTIHPPATTPLPAQAFAWTRSGGAAGAQPSQQGPCLLYQGGEATVGWGNGGARTRGGQPVGQPPPRLADATLARAARRQPAGVSAVAALAPRWSQRWARRGVRVGVAKGHATLGSQDEAVILGVHALGEHGHVVGVASRIVRLSVAP